MDTAVMLYSLVAGLATTLGGGIVLLLGRPRPKVLAGLLGMAAGIMFAVVVFDLLPSAYTQGSLPVVVFGCVQGLALLYGLDIFFSRRLFGKAATPTRAAAFRKMGYMIAVGIALHDLPEGIAIAAGYAATERLGLVIALAIGLHNVPEGMATAAPLVLAGISARVIFLINIAVSLFTPLGTGLGFFLVRISPAMIADLLALAAGAMTYICIGELIPETRRLNASVGGMGALGGFLLMWLVSHWH